MQNTQPLPKWIMHRYSILWKKFFGNEFAYDDALIALSHDSMLGIVLSKLRKNGWLESQLSQEDGRKRLYKLKNPEDAVLGIAAISFELKQSKRGNKK